MDIVFRSGETSPVMACFCSYNISVSNYLPRTSFHLHTMHCMLIASTYLGFKANLPQPSHKQDKHNHATNWSACRLYRNRSLLTMARSPSETTFPCFTRSMTCAKTDRCAAGISIGSSPLYILGTISGIVFSPASRTEIIWRSRIFRWTPQNREGSALQP